ncbi:hypothetical protein [Treponema sp. R8-4-B8]
MAGGTEEAVCPIGLAGFASMKALSTRNDEPARSSFLSNSLTPASRVYSLKIPFIEESETLNCFAVREFCFKIFGIKKPLAICSFSKCK